MRAWSGTLSLLTYQEGAPNPNPPFDLFQTQRFNYPYTLRENLTWQRSEIAWRAVFLENEYLKCSILPDLGGHLYTCIDKLSGEPMFYANPSIKKAQIGYRGAWAAFGIEFNFPISHNWVSMSPVDFAYGTHPDGSASVTVGNIDRVYGMEWMVELRLRPGSTLLEERVTLSNRSDMRRRFYWWNNAAVQVWDDSRIEYPMRYAASHGFASVQPWPVDQSGRDLSIIRNQTNGPVSLFVHGSREPFMAIWHPHNNTGIVHFADYAALPGKKIWSWGSDADGLDWRKALSDNDSAYAEVQAGLFRNQETYAFLEPRQSIHFSEFWMPVRGLGGIERANLHGVVNLTRRGNNLLAAFNANERIEHATVRVLDGRRVLAEEHLDLAPCCIWKREVPIRDSQERYTFELADASGKVLLSHTEGGFDWTPVSQIQVGAQASYHMEPVQRRTEDEWLQLGRDLELNGKVLLALRNYDEALANYPQSFGLHKAAGRLAASLLRYAEAVQHLAPLLSREVTDPEVAYYLATAHEGLGDEVDARTEYESAFRLPQFRAASAVRLGELESRAGRWTEAERFLQAATEAAPGDLRAIEELVAVQRTRGQIRAADALAAKSLQDHPLSYFLREELGQSDLPHLGADPYRVLNIAAEYMRLGLYGPALRVLSRDYPSSSPEESEPGTVLPQRHVLVAYFRAYCRQEMGGSAATDYAAASKLSTRLVFPSGARALEVLTAAVNANSSDGTARYLLGTLFFAQGSTDAALESWRAALQLAPTTPTLHADIGRVLLHIKEDPQSALPFFRDGIAIDPQNATLYTGIDQALSLLRRPPQERVQALTRFPDLVHMPSELTYELALNDGEAGDFAAARALFRNRFFPREEGGTNVRQVWIELNLLQGLSQARARQCDSAVATAEHLTGPVAGLSFTQNGLAEFAGAARTQYLLGVIESECGRPELGRSHFERAERLSGPGEIYWAYAAARKLGFPNSTEWHHKLELALEQVKTNSESSSYASWWVYTEGMLDTALGKSREADADFKRALLLADQRMAHHLIRLAQSTSTQE